MITHVTSNNKFPNLWWNELVPRRKPKEDIPADLQQMPCWYSGNYYKDCGNLNKDGLYKDIDVEKLIRLDFKVPPGRSPNQELADNHFSLMVIELEKFMNRDITKILHLDFMLDNLKEEETILNAMKHRTTTSHLEIQYPLADTKSKLDYSVIENGWKSITIKHGHIQKIELDTNAEGNAWGLYYND
tara:strand:+ start:2824 stop:3384 length:561 start_codon:yes stop_codon:yes gene_type:complete